MIQANVDCIKQLKNDKNELNPSHKNGQFYIVEEKFWELLDWI